MDQLIRASLFHTHYWDEVGMLEVPAAISSGRQPKQEDKDKDNECATQQEKNEGRGKEGQ